MKKKYSTSSHKKSKFYEKLKNETGWEPKNIYFPKSISTSVEPFSKNRIQLSQTREDIINEIMHDYRSYIYTLEKMRPKLLEDLDSLIETTEKIKEEIIKKHITRKRNKRKKETKKTKETKEKSIDYISIFKREAEKQEEAFKIYQQLKEPSKISFKLKKYKKLLKNENNEENFSEMMDEILDTFLELRKIAIASYTNKNEIEKIESIEKIATVMRHYFDYTDYLLIKGKNEILNKSDLLIAYTKKIIDETRKEYLDDLTNEEVKKELKEISKIFLQLKENQKSLKEKKYNTKAFKNELKKSLTLRNKLSKILDENKKPKDEHNYVNKFKHHTKFSFSSENEEKNRQAMTMGMSSIYLTPLFINPNPIMESLKDFDQPLNFNLDPPLSVESNEKLEKILASHKNNPDPFHLLHQYYSKREKDKQKDETPTTPHYDQLVDPELYDLEKSNEILDPRLYDSKEEKNKSKKIKSKKSGDQKKKRSFKK